MVDNAHVSKEFYSGINPTLVSPFMNSPSNGRRSFPDEFEESQDSFLIESFSSPESLQGPYYDNFIGDNLLGTFVEESYIKGTELPSNILEMRETVDLVEGEDATKNGVDIDLEHDANLDTSSLTNQNN